MRKLSVLFLMCASLAVSLAQTPDYTCQDPPYYTLGESLYSNSPSTQMEFTHFLVGLFNGRSGRSVFSNESEDESTNPAHRVRIQQTYINGVAVTILTPSSIRNNKKILYFHGGGYSNQLIPFQWDMAIDIANKSGSPVYIVRYRLVPDHIFPAPIEDGDLVYSKLLETINAEEIVFMGDSAGGGLALGLAGKLRDENRPLPVQLVLISPWLDVASDNPDMLLYDDLDMMLSVDGTQQGGIDYVGEHNLEDLDHPYASPLLLENLQELPPCLLFIGTHEILYPDALQFKTKAEDHGMELTFVQVEGGFHVWLGAPAWLVQESAWARRQVASFINCFDNGGRLSGVAESEELVSPLRMKIIPNPGSHTLALEIFRKEVDEINDLQIELEICDVTGFIHHRSSFIHNQEVLSKQLPSNLSNGQYFLSVTANGFSSSLPFLIIK